MRLSLHRGTRTLLERNGIGGRDSMLFGTPDQTIVAQPARVQLSLLEDPQLI